MASMSLVKFNFTTPRAKTDWLEWCEELKKRSEEVHETLRREGVRVEACFLSKSENACYYLMQAEDIKKALEVSEKSILPIDLEHQTVFKKCLDYAEKLTPLFIFSEKLDINEPS